MSITYDQLYHLFMWAWMGGMGSNEAWVHRHDGRGYCFTDWDDSMNEAEPEDFPSDDWLLIPDKRDLDLGSYLVFRFADEQLSPDQQQEVRNIFSRKGAYRRFKFFLGRSDQLDAWNAYQNTHEESAIRAWAEEQGIVLREDDEAPSSEAR
ncbi:MAG: hypothetical protein EA402_07525 [Planctomycetota bacterium]|nr:MAG: hypothetical protein EA402_07525 [Planctomycetota bacterium]